MVNNILIPTVLFLLMTQTGFGYRIGFGIYPNVDAGRVTARKGKPSTAVKEKFRRRILSHLDDIHTCYLKIAKTNNVANDYDTKFSIKLVVKEDGSAFPFKFGMAPRAFMSCMKKTSTLSFQDLKLGIGKRYVLTYWIRYTKNKNTMDTIFHSKFDKVVYFYDDLVKRGNK